MFRFACSEKIYLAQLVKDLKEFGGDGISVTDSTNEVPYGNIEEQPILQNLIDALQFKGPHAVLIPCVSLSPTHRWLDTRTSEHIYEKKDKVQSVVLKMLKGPSHSPHMSPGRKNDEGQMVDIRYVLQGVFYICVEAFFVAQKCLC